MTEFRDNIDRLIDLTARTESGGKYDRWNWNDNGAGVSAGLIQFNSKKGSLSTLLRRMHAKAPERFRRLAPEFWDMLIDEQFIRKEDLNHPIVKEEILALLRESEFHQVQRDLAREGYFNRAWKTASSMGIESERGIAMCFDVAVQYGAGGLQEKLTDALTHSMRAHHDTTERHVLEELAGLADTHTYDQNRRHKLLSSPDLSDAPFDPDGQPPPPPRAVLQRGDRGEDVTKLQQALIELGFLRIKRPSGVFAELTEIAVLDFQSAHQLLRDGRVGPLTRAALEREAGRKTT